MKEKLAFLAPFPEFAEIIHEVAAECKEDITTFAGIGNYPTVEELERQGFEVIITRGPMVDILRRTASIPVIRCDPSAFDLLKAFAKAKQYASSIGIITSWELLFDKTTIEKLLDISIPISEKCSTKEEIRQQVRNIADSGLKVVVGGTITSEMAPQFNLTCIKLFTGREAIVESIEKAKETIRVSREKRAEAERINIILNLEQNGILSINEEKIVTVFNSAAEEITGIKKEKILGESIETFLPNRSILECLYKAKSNYGELVTFGKVSAVNNVIPIVVNGRAVGVVSTYQEVNRLQETEAKVRRAINKKGFVAKCTLEDLIYGSNQFKPIVMAAQEYAQTDSTILISGETGTGKGVLAQGIHLASRRAKGAFVTLNCSALSESLLESELFGYEEGAFTGARRSGRQGLFELAHQGTIFLDEIAATSLHLQSRLLRVVEEKEVMRVGGNQIIPLDVRIVAASNRDLRKCSMEGSFLPDLYYRLNVLSLKIPPLRERKEDIIPLFRYFLNKKGESAKEIENTLVTEFAQILLNYSWPGNVRELENFVEKITSLSHASTASLDYIKQTIIEEFVQNQQIDSNRANKDGIHVQIGSLEEMENAIIRKLYRKYHGNKTRLSKQLQISRTTLWKKLDNIQHDQLINEIHGD